MESQPVAGCGKLASGNRKTSVCYGYGQEEKRQAGEGSAPQTGPAPQELALRKEGEFVLQLILLQEAARKQDEAGLHQNLHFASGRGPLYRAVCCPIDAAEMVP